MPPVTSIPAGEPCWIDLFTSDPDRSADFYGQLFGWTVDDPGPEYGGYVNFRHGDARVGGCMRNDGGSGSPDLWSVYLASDDAKATVDAAEANGGSVIVPAMDVMDLGVMAVVTDPGGAAVGVWEPRGHRGFGVVREPGAPAWFELYTRDLDPAIDFYRCVFGWDVHVVGDTPEFRYVTLGRGEDQRAGVMDGSGFLPEGVPAHWMVYFRVDDADATLGRIEELGGSVIMPAEDTPHGRLAWAADPTGAQFKLLS